VRIIRTGTTGNLEGPTIESRLRRDFPHISRPALDPTLSPTQWTTPGGEGGVIAARAWRRSLTSYSTEVKESVEL